MVSHCCFYLFDSETELVSQSQLRLSWLETQLKKKKKLKKKKTEIMTSGPITSWQIEGGKWKH